MVYCFILLTLATVDLLPASSSRRLQKVAKWTGLSKLHCRCVYLGFLNFSHRVNPVLQLPAASLATALILHKVEILSTSKFAMLWMLALQRLLLPLLTCWMPFDASFLWKWTAAGCLRHSWSFWCEPPLGPLFTWTLQLQCEDEASEELCATNWTDKQSTNWVHKGGGASLSRSCNLSNCPPVKTHQSPSPLLSGNRLPCWKKKKKTLTLANNISLGCDVCGGLRFSTKYKW